MEVKLIATVETIPESKCSCCENTTKAITEIVDVEAFEFDCNSTYLSDKMMFQESLNIMMARVVNRKATVTIELKP